MEFDVVIVGAGPASLAAAIRRSQVITAVPPATPGMNNEDRATSTL
jgi:2-polyprenyl-6-methoxyphenol hydroxylase-like FAD-dependent oxidoreductase